MKSLKEHLLESLMVEANETTVVNAATKIFKKYLNKKAEIDGPLEDFIRDNYKVDSNGIQHSDGLIFWSTDEGWVIILDSGGDWSAHDNWFVIHEIKAIKGTLDDDKVWDAVYDA